VTREKGKGKEGNRKNEEEKEKVEEKCREQDE
jgi:hypothetical protein